jgi:hypothetical protein
MVQDNRRSGCIDLAKNMASYGKPVPLTGEFFFLHWEPLTALICLLYLYFTVLIGENQHVSGIGDICSTLQSKGKSGKHLTGVPLCGLTDHERLQAIISGQQVF